MLATLVLVMAMTGAERPLLEPADAVRRNMDLRKGCLAMREEEIGQLRADLKALRTKKINAVEKKRQTMVLTAEFQKKLHLYQSYKPRADGPTPISPDFILPEEFGPFGSFFHVIQVLGTNSVLARGQSIEAEPFILYGVSTAGITDGAKLQPPGLYVVVGQKSYTAVSGGSKTVHVLSPVPGDAWPIKGKSVPKANPEPAKAQKTDKRLPPTEEGRET